MTTDFEKTDLIFFDIETTGLAPDRHEVIEFAATRVPREISRWKERSHHAFVRAIPEHIETADSYALELNGYTPEAWRNAVAVRYVVEELAHLCKGGGTLVGHNPVFDMLFISRLMNRFEIKLESDYHILDTASMAWPMVLEGLVPNQKLRTLCEFFKVPNEGEHRASSDVSRTMAVYRGMIAGDPG